MLGRPGAPPAVGRQAGLCTFCVPHMARPLMTRRGTIFYSVLCACGACQV